MRPQTFDEYVGQAHLVGPSTAFRKAVERKSLGSVLFWGPPGVGKTTLAVLVAEALGSRFERISAVSAGVADLRKVVEEAQRHRGSGLFRGTGGGTVLFIDEIHRFNKAQQDAILPYVEDGTVQLIGATTENPSFEVNSALLSRMRVFTLNPIDDEDLSGLLDRALADESRGYGKQGLTVTDEARALLLAYCSGDARALLNGVEACAGITAEGGAIDADTVKSALQRRVTRYDRQGEEHYNLISALHKSVRGSDPDASLYWLARMLDQGEDPMYIARRLVRMATEDVGLAEPQALPICMAAQQAVHLQGMPEGALALAQATVFLAVANKSNAIYTAYAAAMADVKETRNDPVPLHLRNAPTALMKEHGYGSGYKYAHDFADGIVGQVNLPDQLKGKVYYHPTGRGYESKIQARLTEIERIQSEGQDRE